ncbi:MAG: hypothetical protein OEX22_01490 [Cyclobacteriaceae bacterium]|nr:hypothetical protein [Cyclobacteriaceae bacterium]
MEVVIEYGKLLIPAALVLYAMYLTIKSFLNKELEKTMLEIRGRSIETILPTRLQAYERMCLFLERISPNSLVARLNNGEYTAKEFQFILLNEIREEYNHNVSQQVYMSDEVWTKIKNAKEELIASVNNAAAKLGNEATNADLSRQLLEDNFSKESDLIALALHETKNEIRQVF